MPYDDDPFAQVREGNSNSSLTSILRKNTVVQYSTRGASTCRLACDKLVLNGVASRVSSKGRMLWTHQPTSSTVIVVQ